MVFKDLTDCHLLCNAGNIQNMYYYIRKAKRVKQWSDADKKQYTKWTEQVVYNDFI